MTRLHTRVAIFRVALRQRSRDLMVLGSRMGLFALVVFVFKQLWTVLLVEGSDVREHVWYLAITEWVLLVQPRVHLEIENDVRSGELTYHLTRPVSYLSFRLSEALAELLIGMLALGVFGFAYTYLIAGGLPSDPRGLLVVVPLGLCAALLALCFHVLIGLSSMWLFDCSPVYVVWQKMTFVLGGLMIPLTLYPAWLRTIAEATPFSALLSGPGSLAFGLHAESVWRTTLRLGAWLALAVWLVRRVYERGVRRVELHGG